MTKRVFDRLRNRRPVSATGGADLRSTITQGVAALAISGLGLAVAGSVALTATAQSAPATRSAVTADAGAPNDTRAVPDPEVDDAVSADVQAADEAADNVAESQGEDGSLQAFSREGEGRAGRDTVRASLDAAVEDKTAAQRTTELAEATKKAKTESRKAVTKERAEAMKVQVEAQRRQEQRAQEAKKKAEEAAREAGLDPNDQGTLQNVPAPAPLADAPTGGVATTPIARGQYRVGAFWGKTGIWSRYHTGQDMPAPTGTPMRAAMGGTVMPSSAGGWAGTHVIIRHPNGSSTLYAHMSSKSVSPGQQVQTGQNIGAVGNTGRSFGSHLHLEYYKPGVRPGDIYSSSDPRAWLASMGVQL